MMTFKTYFNVFISRNDLLLNKIHQLITGKFLVNSLKNYLEKINFSLEKCDK